MRDLLNHTRVITARLDQLNDATKAGHTTKAEDLHRHIIALFCRFGREPDEAATRRIMARFKAANTDPNMELQTIVTGRGPILYHKGTINLNRLSELVLW